MLLEQLWKAQEACFSLRISASPAGPSDHVHVTQYVVLIPRSVLRHAVAP